MSESSEEYSLITTVWRGEGVTMYHCLPFGQQPSEVEQMGLMNCFHRVWVQAVLSNYLLSCAHRITYCKGVTKSD